MNASRNFRIVRFGAGVFRHASVFGLFSAAHLFSALAISAGIV
jgi:hypothetical protein